MDAATQLPYIHEPDRRVRRQWHRLFGLWYNAYPGACNRGILGSGLLSSSATAVHYLSGAVHTIISYPCSLMIHYSAPINTSHEKPTRPIHRITHFFHTFL